MPCFKEEKKWSKSENNRWSCYNQRTTGSLQNLISADRRVGKKETLKQADLF